MQRKMIVNNGKISSNSVLGMRQDILKNVTDKRTVIQVIDLYIEHINNYRNPDYKPELNVMDIINIDAENFDKVLDDLKNSLIKMRREYEDREKKEKKQLKNKEKEEKWNQIKETINKSAEEGKQGTKKEIIEKIIADISEGNSEYEFTSKEKKSILKNLNGMLDETIQKEDTQKRNAEKAMEQILETVEREYEAGNITNKAKYLSSIRSAITGENKEFELNIKMDEIAQQQLLEMIDSNIKIEKEEFYFDQVRSFTNNFQFLREYPEIAGSKYGASQRNKFTDVESYERFCALRELLKEHYNEEEGIGKLLKRKNIHDTDIRILTARQEVIEQEREDYR